MFSRQTGAGRELPLGSAALQPGAAFHQDTIQGLQWPKAKSSGTNPGCLCAGHTGLRHSGRSPEFTPAPAAPRAQVLHSHTVGPDTAGEGAGSGAGWEKPPPDRSEGRVEAHGFHPWNPRPECNLPKPRLQARADGQQPVACPQQNYVLGSLLRSSTPRSRAVGPQPRLEQSHSLFPCSGGVGRAHVCPRAQTSCWTSLCPSRGTLGLCRKDSEAPTADGARVAETIDSVT